MIWFVSLMVGILVVWRPWQARYRQPSPSPNGAPPDVAGNVETVWITSQGTPMEGWLFTPEGDTDIIIVMAPGLTSTKDTLLEPFAWSFVADGAAVLLFDFRSLGGSDGLPRHNVDPMRQIEDYEAVLEHVADQFDQVLLWGSSFSAGAAMIAAAKHPEISAWCGVLIARYRRCGANYQNLEHAEMGWSKISDFATRKHDSGLRSRPEGLPG